MWTMWTLFISENYLLNPIHRIPINNNLSLIIIDGELAVLIDHSFPYNIYLNISCFNLVEIRFKMFAILISDVNSAIHPIRHMRCVHTISLLTYYSIFSEKTYIIYLLLISNRIFLIILLFHPSKNLLIILKGLCHLSSCPTL